jgi:tetratricopeptide (TPR) repeat protein
LVERALLLEDNRLKQNPNDVDALYCRGVTHGLKSTYMALVDKSFVSALRNAVSARRDHERVLELDPKYIDAKTVVGAHLYVVGSLPLPLKVLAGITGLSGSKKKGLQYLNEVGASKAGTSVDARVALALFLRREAQYPEALKVVRTLEAEHPRNFLFALEAANLLKDEGDGPAAAVAYRRLLQHATIFFGAHLELAAFGLGEVLRGQRDFVGAQEAYDLIAEMKSVQPELRTRALLAAGEMYDQSGNRGMAMKRYNQVVGSDNAGKYAAVAEKHMRRPLDLQHGLMEQDF